MFHLYLLFTMMINYWLRTIHNLIKILSFLIFSARRRYLLADHQFSNLLGFSHTFSYSLWSESFSSCLLFILLFPIFFHLIIKLPEFFKLIHLSLRYNWRILFLPLLHSKFEEFWFGKFFLFFFAILALFLKWRLFGFGRIASVWSLHLWIFWILKLLLFK